MFHVLMLIFHAYLLIYNLINYFCSRFYRFIFITIMAVVQSGEEKKSQDFADIIIQKSPLWEIGVLPCGAVEVDQKKTQITQIEFYTSSGRHGAGEVSGH